MRKTHLKIPFSFVALIVGIILFFGFKFKSENPKVAWDTSPDNLVISYEFFIPRHIDYNYISDFRIWGDGYIVWVEHQPDGNRKVFEGNLSQEQLRNLIEQFVDAGFFKWFIKSPNGSYEDLIRISLINRNSSVQYDTNRKIYELVMFIQSGAGSTPREYIPSIGYLYVVPAKEAGLPEDIQPKHHWSSEIFGYELETIRNNPDNGRIEVTGKELLFIWEIVNSSSAVVESNGKVYWIAVIIPKITN